MSVTLVISDIHANPWALQAVLDHAAQFSYNEIWFLGDLWGYGPEPHRVWNMLFESSHKPVLALVGNHDWAICGIPAGSMRPEAQVVIDEHQRLLVPSVIEQIKSLPVMCSPRPGVYLAHGEIAATCAKSIRGYLNHPLHAPDRLARFFFKAQDADGQEKVLVQHPNPEPLARLFTVGQTHMQRLWVWDSEATVWREQEVKQYTWDDLNRQPIMLNPGSVGFARDGSGCPGYAIINWQAHTLSFHRVRYDTAPLKRAMQLPPYRALITDPHFFIEPDCRGTV